MESPPEIQSELENAERARERGNEGQARVCARRAAGLAARLYLARGGNPPRSSSAYDVLRIIADEPLLSARAREIAEHLTLRVNEEFKLPPDIDLIGEARELCDELLGPSPSE
jgi:HEPN domain-containing protein